MVVRRSLVQTTVRATRRLSTIVMISSHKDRWVLFGPLHTIDPNYSRLVDPLPFSDCTSHRRWTHETCWHPNLQTPPPQTKTTSPPTSITNAIAVRPTCTRPSKTLYGGATSLEHGWGGESTARSGGLHRSVTTSACDTLKSARLGNGHGLLHMLCASRSNMGYGHAKR